MKDIGSTNLVPGTRTRSDNTMHVSLPGLNRQAVCLCMRGASVSCRKGLAPSPSSVAAVGHQHRAPATGCQVQEATEVFRRFSLRTAPVRSPVPARALSMLRDPAVAAAASTAASSSAAASAAAAAASLEQPARPPSSQSMAPSMATTSRPFSAAASAALAGAVMSYQSFCAALVLVASKVARSSPETLEACPFLSVCGAPRAAWRGLL